MIAFSSKKDEHHKWQNFIDIYGLIKLNILIEIWVKDARVERNLQKIDPGSLDTYLISQTSYRKSHHI